MRVLCIIYICPFWAAREYPSLLASSFVVFITSRDGVEGRVSHLRNF